MKRVFMLTAVAGLCLCLAADVAQPGLNAGASAHIYWITSSNTASTIGTSYEGYPRCLITVKGVRSFRGAEVQAWVQACDLGELAAAWQAQPGGCAEGADRAYGGGFHSGSATLFPSILTADPPVAALDVSRPGSMFYGPGDCWARSRTATIWYSALGAAGVTRNPTIEYGVFGYTLYLTSGCEGGLDSPSAPACVWIWPMLRQSCHSGCKGNVIAITDANGDVDYAPFAPLGRYLSWWGSPGVGDMGYLYDCTTPVAPATWGSVRRLYR
jgi:hypothetical protein